MKRNVSQWMGAAFLGLAGLMAGPSAARAQSLDFFLIAKGQYCFQESDALPEGLLLDNTVGPVQFIANAEGSGITGAVLRVPGVPAYSVEMDTDEFEEGYFFLEERFELIGGENTPEGPTLRLNSTFPGGTYHVTNFTSAGGTLVRSLTLAALGTNVLPRSPFISNMDALREMDPTQPFVIRWIEHGPGASSEFVRISIEDEFGDDVVESPDFGEPGQLTGASAKMWTIPADTLQAGQRYEGRILFANVVVNAASGGTRLVGAFFMETGFEINPIPPQGRIGLTATNYTVNENAGSVAVTLTRYGGSSGAASVELNTANGSAVHGSDYSGHPEPIIVAFADGQTETTVNIPITDDTSFEGNETFRVVLDDPDDETGADLGRSQATVTIVDNENPNAPVFNLAATNVVVSEAVASVVLTVQRTGDATATDTVDIATKNHTAVSGSDYLANMGQLVFAPGERSKTFTVTLVNDAFDEIDESFLVCLSNPSEGASLGPRSTASVLITDNDTAGRFSFSAALYRVTEANTNADLRILVRRTGGGATGARVRVFTTAGSADDDDDFTAVNTVLDFASNVVEQAVFIPIVGDETPEMEEAFQVSLSLPDDSGGALPGPITNATVQILDDEISIGFRSLSYSNSEAGPVANIAIVRSGPLTAAAAVQYATADGTAEAGKDYLATNGTLVLPAGMKEKNFAVRLLNDALVEGSETVLLALHSPSNAQLVAEATNAVLTLGDNDTGGVIQFASTNITTTEAGRQATILVNRTGAGLASNVTVCLLIEDGPELGGAVNPDDYSPTNAAGVVTNKIVLEFRAVERSKMVRVPLINDQLAEGIETFRARLEEPTGGASLGARSNTVVQVRDNDVGGKINFSRAAYSVNENSNLVVTIARSGGAASNVTVIFKSFSNATATAGIDFEATTLPITFAAGQTATNILVPINQDGDPEGDERFQLSLMDPAGGGMVGPLSNAVVTIVDDESSISFTNAMYMVAETGPSVTINAVRSGARLTQVSVDVTITAGTASSPADHKGTNVTLVFPPNVAFKSIVIPIVNDLLDEDDEDFTVSLGNPQPPEGVLLGTVTNTTVVIKDNDAGGVIQFSAPTYSGTEGGPAAGVMIKRTLPPGSPAGTTLATNVSVTFMTSNRTATAGQDYTGVTSNVLFGAGQTTKTVAVPILTDSTNEPVETAGLHLDGASGGATLGTNNPAELRINNAAPPPGSTTFFFTATTSPGGAFRADMPVADRLIGIFTWNVEAGLVVIAPLDPQASVSAPARTIDIILPDFPTSTPGLPLVIPIEPGDGIYHEQTANLSNPSMPLIKQWTTTESTTGSITITEYDAANKILAGTGSFTATPDPGIANNSATGTANITNIRFRVKFD